MTSNDMDKIAKPTIAEVLLEFLDDQRKRLKPRTMQDYDFTIALLQDALNGYAYNYLDEEDAEMFDRFYEAEGDNRREFCEVFGPEHILPYTEEFLGDFIIRKVMAGKDFPKVAAKVIKKLVKWMKEKGYADPAEADIVVEASKQSGKEGVKAEELANLLYEYGMSKTFAKPNETLEEYFTFSRVEKDKFWAEAMDGREIGPFEVPERIASVCKEGWSFSGLVGRVGKKWHVLGVGNVYPV